MGARSKLVEGVIKDFDPHTLIDYYWGMRTLVSAWAITGNYEVESVEKPGTKVLMMPADEAIDYADRGLRLASRSPGSTGEQLHWWARKDLLTRTLMANYVIDRMPAGEALRAALKECASDWTIVKQGEIQGQHESMVDGAWSAVPMGASWLDQVGMSDAWENSGGGGSGSNQNKKKPTFAERNGKGQGGKSAKKAKGKGKSERGRSCKVGSIASISRSGEKLCGAFNSRKGCNGKKCPQNAAHYCAVVTHEDGTVCRSPKHGASSHH